ncbi:hypothetical protein RE6C_03612 [Rhodopirellula europaea 6C]|uniref:Uncharacterized protein n=1 Tax=Rhodopirellula europaea 6C TaxID=1263867 RepID=M2A5Q3_9BACT|nr:hypothetical protein RE6C_03612 [Rhodopirellula europaea 6C]
MATDTTHSARALFHRKPNGEWFGEEARNEPVVDMHEACQEPGIAQEGLNNK